MEEGERKGERERKEGGEKREGERRERRGTVEREINFKY